MFGVRGLCLAFVSGIYHDAEATLSPWKPTLSRYSVFNFYLEQGTTQRSGLAQGRPMLAELCLFPPVLSLSLHEYLRPAFGEQREDWGE